MGVLISNKQNRHTISLKTIQTKAQVVLDALGSPDSELSILIVDDPQIAELNQQYLQRQGPTNVIAFPMQEGDFAEVTPQLLGDVVISADTAAREGALAGISMEARLIELLVHGVLHLCGYDHEQHAAQALEMENKSKEILQLIERV